MVNNKHNIIIFFLFSLQLCSQAQCELYMAKDQINATNENKFIEVKINKDSIVFQFRNNTKKPIYIFSSYLKNEFINLKYLNRIDKKNDLIINSFAPLIPNIFAFSRNKYLTDAETRLLSFGQIKPEFIYLSPNTIYSKSFKKETSDFVKKIDTKSLGLFDKIKFKNTKFSKKKEYQFLFEFAVYHNIDYLCHIDFFAKNPKEYENRVKNFEIYTVSGNEFLSKLIEND